MSLTKRLPKELRLALILLVAAIAFKAFNQLTADYDLWIHTLAGKLALTHGIAFTDTLSFTVPGTAVTNHEWLSQMIVGWADRAGGATGLILWRWLMVIPIALLALRLILRKTESDLAAIIAAIGTILIVQSGISFRLHLFSYLPTLALLNLIYTDGFWTKKRSLFFVSLLFALWSNLHGAFSLGLVVWGAYTISTFRWDLKKVVTWIGVPGLAALFCNPYQFELLFYLLHEMSAPLSGQYITEWQSFSFAGRELGPFAIAVLAWIGIILDRKQVLKTETILFLFMSCMALSSVRHFPLLGIVTLPALAAGINSLIRRLPSDSGSTPDSSLIVKTAAIVVSLSAAFFAYLGSQTLLQIRTDHDPLPRNIVSFLKEEKINGKLWTPLHWGGYTLYHLAPAVKTSVDGRWAMVYPHTVMQDNMDFAFNGVDGQWKAILKKYSADMALVESGNPAWNEMTADPDWQWLLSEPAGALLVRRGFIKKGGNWKLPKAPVAVWPW